MDSLTLSPPWPLPLPPPLAKPWPLGATWDGEGINFALFSKNASSVELCLFDSEHQLISSIELTRSESNIWYGYLSTSQNPLFQPGLLYAYRVIGPWLPAQGHRFDSSRLLLDPYAKHIVADSNGDSASPLKACVLSDQFNWGYDSPVQIAAKDTVLYEVHVKGFSKCNTAMPLPLRGTYLGLSHSVSIAHLKGLGVTSVSLLPVHYWIDETRLQSLGLRNYWGYNSIGFFAASPKYACAESSLSVRDQFREMVKTLHVNGIEVILDVVYNHTAESDKYGPTLSFRGIDNASYYRLTEAPEAHEGEQERHYENYSGCGNVLDIRQPAVLRLVMDSLRYWVSDMHVDGFRFDLAPILGRDTGGFNAANAFFMALQQDPVLNTVKLIAEPWDIGPNGYQLGQFPLGWLEWNDKFRDTVRSFWLQQGGGAAVIRGEFARRLCASSDVFEDKGRRPWASVNFVTSHDGFTLRDLVSYNERHNEANGENNRDGHGHNLSNNCGAEGPSLDATVLERRSALQRALLATMLLAQGTPMLCSGDEIGKTQLGNNNAYCQDNELSWLNWQAADHSLNQFVAKVLSLRKTLGGLANGQWYGEALKWFEPSGTEIVGSAWDDPQRHAFYCSISNALVIAFNPGSSAMALTSPEGTWQVLLDTSSQSDELIVAIRTFQMPANGLLVLQKI